MDFLVVTDYGRASNRVEDNAIFVREHRGLPSDWLAGEWAIGQVWMICALNYTGVAKIN